MDTLFMNSEISKTSDPRRLIINLTDKKKIKNTFLFQILASIIHGKI